MKHTFYALLAVAIIAGLSSSAFAEGLKKYHHGQHGQAAGPYSAMEPAAGDPTRQVFLDWHEIKKVQSTLNYHGYNSGPVDGVMGPMTRGAIRRFQLDNGLNVTGTTTSETVAELGINVRPKMPLQRSPGTREGMMGPDDVFRSEEQYMPNMPKIPDVRKMPETPKMPNMPGIPN